MLVITYDVVILALFLTIMLKAAQSIKHFFFFISHNQFSNKLVSRQCVSWYIPLSNYILFYTVVN